VLTVFVEFSHANALPPPAFHIMSTRRIRSRPAQKSRSVGGQRGTSEWQVPGPWSFHSQPHLVQPPRLAASKARPSRAANLAAASRVLMDRVMDRVAITRAYPIAPRPASAGAPKKAPGASLLIRPMGGLWKDGSRGRPRARRRVRFCAIAFRRLCPNDCRLRPRCRACCHLRMTCALFFTDQSPI
jgi:hypothetical protein